MKLYGDKYYFKKFFPKSSKKNLNKISSIKLRLIHKIFNTVNLSLIILIFIYSFISINSQRKWSKTYGILSKTKTKNNSLIDYISKTEEFYISELESFKTLKKTTPRDLIYLENVQQNKEIFFNKQIINIINGLKDSKYQTGY